VFLLILTAVLPYTPLLDMTELDMWSELKLKQEIVEIEIKMSLRIELNQSLRKKLNLKAAIKLMIDNKN